MSPLSPLSPLARSIPQFTLAKHRLAAHRLLAGSTQVSLVAHSVGGWLARLYLAEYGRANVAMLLSLGSPHLPPPQGAEGEVDQTRVGGAVAQATGGPNSDFESDRESGEGSSSVSVEESEEAVAGGQVQVASGGGEFQARMVGQRY
ncbi:unnamed protein product [Closterium sp. Naga37s-1]|nr:unnamed protein product [Closterium sp. Naga37s-1]